MFMCVCVCVCPFSLLSSQQEPIFLKKTHNIKRSCYLLCVCSRTVTPCVFECSVHVGARIYKSGCIHVSVWVVVCVIVMGV